MEKDGEAVSDTEPVFEYEGPCYVRPVSRGVILGAPEDNAARYIEDVVPDGDYRISVRFFALPEESEVVT